MSIWPKKFYTRRFINRGHEKFNIIHDVVLLVIRSKNTGSAVVFTIPGARQARRGGAQRGQAVVLACLGREHLAVEHGRVSRFVLLRHSRRPAPPPVLAVRDAGAVHPRPDPPCTQVEPHCSTPDHGLGFLVSQEVGFFFAEAAGRGRPRWDLNIKC